VVQEAVPIPRYPGRRMQKLRHTTNASRGKCLAVQSCVRALKRPPRLSTCHIKHVCSSRDGAYWCSCFVQEKRGSGSWKHPRSSLVEICLNPEFASPAVAESHAPPSSSSFLFPVSCVLSFLRPSQVLHSRVCQLQASHWHFSGPRDPLARLPQELG